MKTTSPKSAKPRFSALKEAENIFSQKVKKKKKKKISRFLARIFPVFFFENRAKFVDKEQHF